MDAVREGAEHSREPLKLALRWNEERRRRQRNVPV